MKTAQQLIEEHCTADLEKDLERCSDLTPDERESTLECWRHESFEEFRCSGEATGLAAPSSRHYECEINAAKIGEFWVAWPYWHGGGKHGCPEEIPWLEDAFYVNVRQETRTVNVFERQEPS